MGGSKKGKRGGNGDPSAEISKKPPPPSSSLCDGLLFATLCIVGHLVEVQVRDGSVYSGIFYTACLAKGYGIILKKARQIGNGKRDNNFAVGDLVDTLVVDSGDLVQVVVKDFLFPAEGVVCNTVADCVGAASGAVELQKCNVGLERGLRGLKSGKSSPSGIQNNNQEKKTFGDPSDNDAKVYEGFDAREVLLSPLEKEQEVIDVRHDIIFPTKVEEPFLASIGSVQASQVVEYMPHGEANFCNHIDKNSSTNKMLHEDNYRSPSDVCLQQVASSNETHGAVTSKKTSNRTRGGSPALLVSPEAPKSTFPNSEDTLLSHSPASTVSNTSTSVLDITTSPCKNVASFSTVPAAKKSPDCKQNAKEFKLNPQAKVFSPSFVNSRAPTVVPTANTGYTPSIPPVIPIAAAQSEVEICSFASRPSFPSKLIQYNSMASVHSSVAAPFSRPIVGHTGARQQPVRFSGQYLPIQPGPAYVPPTSSMVVVGRTGQLVYVHPISQDAIQGTVLPQALPYPLLDPCQVNMSKIQGSTPHSVQLCITPPLVTGTAQPFVVPSHIPFSQPFPVVRPIPVPGGHGFFGSKF